MKENDKNPLIKKRHLYGYRGRTNFYPLYDSENESVEAIQPIHGVVFQRVMPRYDISSSETRDSGLGPMFDGEPPLLLPYSKAVSQSRKINKEVKNPFMGKILDVKG